MRYGRRLGVHVLASMEELSRRSTMQVVSQADYRIVQRTATSEESRQLIGSSRAAELFLYAGLGLFCTSPSADPVYFRAFQVPPDLIRDVGRQLASR